MEQIIYKRVQHGTGQFWVETKHTYIPKKSHHRSHILIIVEEGGSERLVLVPKSEVPNFIHNPSLYNLDENRPPRRSSEIRRRRMEEFGSDTDSYYGLG